MLIQDINLVYNFRYLPLRREMAKLVWWWHPISYKSQFVCAFPRLTHKTSHNTKEMKMHNRLLLKEMHKYTRYDKKEKLHLWFVDSKRKELHLVYPHVFIMQSFKSTKKIYTYFCNALHLPLHNDVAFLSSLVLTFRILIWAYSTEKKVC